MTERFDMDGENPEPPEPADESYADVPDDRVEPGWLPASGARMTDEQWRAMLARLGLPVALVCVAGLLFAFNVAYALAARC